MRLASLMASARVSFLRNACVAAFGLLVSATAGAQNGTISGKITEQTSGGPVTGAEVSARAGVGGAATTRSRENGTYTLSVAPGTYTVSVKGLCCAPKQVDNVVVRAGQTATVDFAMSPAARHLEQMVITGTGGPPEKVQDSPNPISVVDATRIAERPAVTVIDHLDAVSGLSISKGGIGQVNVVSRGFNNAFSTQMLMLQDYRYAGVPSLRVNVPLLFTGTDEDIARIEVLQGPAAALYGPNSGNGVLHVITKSPFESEGTMLTVDGGERSMLRGSLRHAGVFGDRKFGYKLSGEYLTAKDFQYVDPNEPTVYPANDTRIPVERRGKPVTHDFDLTKYSGEARFDYDPSPNTQLISTVGMSGIGNAREITTTFGAAEAKNWTYLNLQERFVHKQFFAQVFYDKSNSGNDNAQDPNGTYYLRTGIPVVDQSSILGLQAQQAANFGRTKFVFGGEYLATRPQTESTINGRNEANDDINEYGGYLQTTTAITKQIDFLAAARLDANSRILGSQFSPRAAIIVHPDENNTFRLTFNRAYSSPTSFSFFLDQYSGQTPAPKMPVQILGNPSKQGWSFARSCTGGAAGNLCMRSPYIPDALAPASAAAAYAGFASQLTAIVQGLPLSSIGSEANRQALLGLLGSPVGAIVRGLRPTDAQVGTVLVDLVTKQPVAGVTDYAPLSADFANTWEVGYKGFLGKRLGLEVDAWFQKRPADPTAQIINPGVLFNPQQLGAYLGQNIAQALIAAGQSPQVAQATAQQAAAALTPLMAAIPVGATAFTNSLDDQPYLVFSYQKATGSVNVHGFDISTDLMLTPEWSVAATYSNLNKNVFADAPGATVLNPLAANTPKHRATATVRYERQVSGFSAEVRGRYADAFPVNSGVFNSYNLGTPIPYAPVPVNALLDAGFSWTLPVARSPKWSVNGTNLLDNKVATFVGVPKLGRVILTRLQYTY